MRRAAAPDPLSERSPERGRAGAGGRGSRRLPPPGGDRRRVGGIRPGRGRGARCRGRWAIGGATGAAGGAVLGRPGTGAAVGAATGATANFMRLLFRQDQPSSAYRNFSDSLPDRTRLRAGRLGVKARLSALLSPRTAAVLNARCASGHQPKRGFEIATPKRLARYVDARHRSGLKLKTGADTPPTSLRGRLREADCATGARTFVQRACIERQ